jgi:ATP-binding cassette subfamily F protein 3
MVVSHDRHLIKTVADTLWLVADGTLRVFDGDLDDYQQWLKSRGSAPQVAEAEKSQPRRAPKRRPAVRLAPLRRELDEIERQLAVLTTERTDIETALQEGATSATLSHRYAELSSDILGLEARWMDIGAAIEAAEFEMAGGT